MRRFVIVYVHCTCTCGLTSMSFLSTALVSGTHLVDVKRHGDVGVVDTHGATHGATVFLHQRHDKRALPVFVFVVIVLVIGRRQRHQKLWVDPVQV